MQRDGMRLPMTDCHGDGGCAKHAGPGILRHYKKKKTNISLPARSKVRHVMWVTSNEVGFDLHHHLLLRLVDYSLRKVQ